MAMTSGRPGSSIWLRTTPRSRVAATPPSTSRSRSRRQRRRDERADGPGQLRPALRRRHVRAVPAGQAAGRRQHRGRSSRPSPDRLANLSACLNTGDNINSALVQYNVSRPGNQASPYPTAKLDGAPSSSPRRTRRRPSRVLRARRTAAATATPRRPGRSSSSVATAGSTCRTAASRSARGQPRRPGERQGDRALRASRPPRGCRPQASLRRAPTSASTTRRTRTRSPNRCSRVRRPRVPRRPTSSSPVPATPRNGDLALRGYTPPPGTPCEGRAARVLRQRRLLLDQHLRHQLQRHPVGVRPRRVLELGRLHADPERRPGQRTCRPRPTTRRRASPRRGSRAPSTSCGTPRRPVAAAPAVNEQLDGIEVIVTLDPDRPEREAAARERLHHRVAELRRGRQRS